jgi:hypothetical protein
MQRVNDPEFVAMVTRNCVISELSSHRYILIHMLYVDIYWRTIQYVWTNGAHEMTKGREQARLHVCNPLDFLQLSWCARTKHLPLCKMQLLKTLGQPATCCRAPPLVHTRSTVRAPQPLLYKRGWPISQITRSPGGAHNAYQPSAQICYYFAQTWRNEDSISYNNNNNNNMLT